jgi:hypothetical protein
MVRRTDKRDQSNHRWTQMNTDLTSQIRHQFDAPFKKFALRNVVTEGREGNEELICRPREGGAQGIASPTWRGGKLYRFFTVLGHFFRWLSFDTN